MTPPRGWGAHLEAGFAFVHLFIQLLHSVDIYWAPAIPGARIG